MPKISVIIPIYNEAATCRQLIERVQAVPLDLEIIVVDDGSTDGSTEILKTIRGMRYLTHEKNRGKGAAVRTALKSVTGAIIILQDGDLEYDPRDYQALLAPILAGYADVVFGSRWQDKQTPHSFHYAGNRMITFFSNIINQSWISDMASCYKAIPTDIFKALKLRSNGFGLEAEITAKIFRKGVTIQEIPVAYARRTSAEGKKLRLRDGLIAVWSCLRYRFLD